METNIFKDFKVQKLIGFGINIVNHEIRCEFDLTVSQYCIIDIINQRKNKKKTTCINDISTFLGIDGNTVHKTLNALEQRKMVINKDDNYYLNKKLANRINNTNTFDDEFEEFWTIKVDDKIKTAWPGPKKKAQDLYKKARKSGRSHKFIMDQRYWYFKLLTVQTFRQKMIATRFLNIDTGELDQDFKGEYEILSKKSDVKLPNASAMTSDDFKNEFL